MVDDKYGSTVILLIRVLRNEKRHICKKNSQSQIGNLFSPIFGMKIPKIFETNTEVYMNKRAFLNI